MGKKNKQVPVEDRLFSYKGWDQYDTADFGFSDCVLKVDIGPFKSGEKIPLIGLSYQSSQISIYSTKGACESGVPDWTGKLVLSVE